jgi:putative toxin-antitoxin system antitoxin component (TIGR02293 family)
MKMAACPVCRTIHEAVGPSALKGADKKRTYRVTHCRLCESPSTTFRPLQDRPELADDELGFPMAVVPWLGADVESQPNAQADGPIATDGASKRNSGGSSMPSVGMEPRELGQLKAPRRLLGGSNLFPIGAPAKFDTRCALWKGGPVDGSVVAEALCTSHEKLQGSRHATSMSMLIDLASRAWSFAETLAAASRVLSGHSAAPRWMSASAIGLDERRPVDLLRAMQGTAVVGDFLRRLEANACT